MRQNAKLILSADLTLETQSFDRAGADIEALAAGAGGYIEASSVSGELGGRYASYTLRVPQEKFETCFAQLGGPPLVSSSRWERGCDRAVHRYRNARPRCRLSMSGWWS